MIPNLKKQTDTWKNICSWSIFTILLISPAIPPAATALNDCYQNKIKETELNHKIAFEWIDSATDEKKSLGCRKKILSFLAAEFANQPLGKWAEDYQIELAKNAKCIEDKKNKAPDSVCELDKAQLYYLAERIGIPMDDEVLSKIFRIIIEAETEKELSSILQALESSRLPKKWGNPKIAAKEDSLHGFDLPFKTRRASQEGAGKRAVTV